MKHTQACVPEIMEHLNPVTEQFGAVSHNADQMQIPDTISDIPRFLYHLLTDAEQEICDKATD